MIASTTKQRLPTGPTQASNGVCAYRSDVTPDVASLVDMRMRAGMDDSLAAGLNELSTPLDNGGRRTIG